MEKEQYIEHWVNTAEEDWVTVKDLLIKSYFRTLELKNHIFALSQKLTKQNIFRKETHLLRKSKKQV